MNNTTTASQNIRSDVAFACPAAVRPLRSTWASVVLIFVVAIGLRISGITFDSMWLDEGYQTMVNSIGVKPDNLEKLSPEPFVYDLGKPNSPQRVLENFRQVDPLCPPLYFLLVNRWMSLFGTTDFAVRSLSALFSIACLAVVYFASRKLFGAKTALCALILQAVSPYDIHYAQEARMYALVTLTSSLSCLSFFFLAKETIWRAWSFRAIACLIAYAISTWALINTHYTGLFIIAFQVLFCTVYSIKHKSLSLFLSFAAGFAAVGLLWLPWFEFFRQAASGRDSYYVNRAPNLIWPLKGTLRIFVNWLSFLSGMRVVAYATPVYATTTALLATCMFFLIPSHLMDKLTRLFQTSTRRSATSGGFNLTPEWAATASSANLTPARAATAGSSNLTLERAATASSASLAPALATAGSSILTPERAAAAGSSRLIPERAATAGSSRTAPDESTTSRSALLLIFCWAVLPAVIALAIDIVETRKTIEISRYLVGTAPAVFILAGFAMKNLLNYRAAMWLVAAHVVFALVNYTYAHIQPQREPWRQMAAIIEKKVPPNDLLLVSPHYDLIPLNRYFTTPRMQVGTGPLLGNEQVSRVLKGRDRFWLLVAQEGGSVEVFIPPRYARKEAINLSHGLHLTGWHLR